MAQIYLLVDILYFLSFFMKKVHSNKGSSDNTNSSQCDIAIQIVHQWIFITSIQILVTQHYDYDYVELFGNYSIIRQILFFTSIVS